MNATPENIRYHAAGHIAAAELISQIAPAAATLIMETVMAYATNERVSAPPQVLEKIDVAAKNPRDSRHEMRLLEEWFCHPLNTMIEQTGIAG